MKKILRVMLAVMVVTIAISANQENPYEDSMEESECYAETGQNCEESAEEWVSENPKPAREDDC